MNALQKCSAATNKQDSEAWATLTHNLSSESWLAALTDTFGYSENQNYCIVGNFREWSESEISRKNWSVIV